MFRRRDQHHHVEAMSRAIPYRGERFLARGVLAACVAVLAAVGAANASGPVVDSDGTVHRLELHAFSQGNTVAGTEIVHVLQQPDGTEARAPVPGTADFAIEASPEIDVDPITGDLFAVWSRHEGTNSGILLARYAGGAWSTPTPLSDVSDHTTPQVRAAAELVHVVWEHGSERLRVSLDRESLAWRFGPEVLPQGAGGAISPDGGTSPVAFDKHSAFFASHVPGEGGNTGIITVWAILDENQPILSSEAFALPTGMRHVEDPKAGFVDGQFAMSFLSGEDFYYTLLRNDEWTALRVIRLDAGRAHSDGLRALAEMVRREDLAANAPPD